MSLGMSPKEDTTTIEVVQFISSTLFFLLFRSTADHQHPSVVRFETYIQNILGCSTNNVTVPVILTALYYIDIYSKRLRQSGITARPSEAKVWVAALMLADAFHNDAAYAVKSWSLLSSIPINECIKIRKALLESLNYDLYVDVDSYQRWIEELKRISSHVSVVLYYNKTQKAQLAAQQTPMVYQSLMRNSSTSYSAPINFIPANYGNISPPSSFQGNFSNYPPNDMLNLDYQLAMYSTNNVIHQQYFPQKMPYQTQPIGPPTPSKPNQYPAYQYQFNL